MSGVGMALTFVGIRVRCRQKASFVVTRGALVLLVLTTALLLQQAILMEITLEVFMYKIVPTIVRYLLELAFVACTTSSFSAIFDFSSREENRLPTPWFCVFTFVVCCVWYFSSF